MRKNLYVLVGIFVALVIIAFLVLQKPGEQSASSSTTGLLVEIDSLAVDRIGIKSPTLAVNLVKRGIEWFVQEPVNYKADQSNVTSLVHQCKILEVKGVVSSKPEKHSVFQVDSTGTLVEVYEKGVEKASFVIGKISSSYTETYARKSNSNDVVLLEGSVGYTFNRSVKDWRDKTILATPKENIKEVRFQYGDTTFVLANKDSLWMIGKDSTQESAVASLLVSLSNIQADDFLDSVPTPASKFLAQIAYSGTQLRFAFVTEKSRYYVQSSATPQWFIIDTWHADQLLKRKKELLKSKK